MQTAIHTPAEMARYWNHPEVSALRAMARQTESGKMSAKERGAAMKVALNAIRDKVSELKARG